MGTFSIKITSGHLETYEALLLQLEDPAAAGTIDRLDLSFGDVTQVFPTAFALLAAYLGRVPTSAGRPAVMRKFGSNPHIGKLDRMMNSIGFAEVVAGGVPKRVSGSGVYPLRPITAEQSPTSVAEELIEMITESATGGNQPTRDAKEIIYVAVSEIVENCQRHAGPDSSALLCGQLSAQKRKLEICLVDTGQGIKRSLASGDNKEAAKRVADGESSPSVAVEPWVGRGGDGNHGLGLFVASEAAALSGGLFRVTSGNETVIVSREGEKQRVHAPWQGTVVNLLLNITRGGSIAEVYREIPLERGENERILAG